MDYILYHGSVESFNKFDENKIREDETDAVYNGFWFSSDKNPSPAWVNPNYRKTCKVRLNNPAPINTVNKVYEKLYNEGVDWSCTRVRKELLKIGYDGVIHENIPFIDKEQLNKKGYYIYETARGSKYKLVLDKNHGGIDLYDIQDEFITGYYNVEDFLKSEELVVVVFTSEQVEILEEIPIQW
ncbi:uncharacterized protein CBO05P1_250 [Clostridium botulinum B str. Osaka05]|uniref:ART-PolyVal-like domain-containing protein n=1 Tax=Clostridium botulinum B str. Osaka05 TaxID=1407017 RepID=A0A060N9M1_CLOBO|nr:hypothetical protein [Clostridium botulinum]BAO04969.1 uncharacterized protein CBO05P1_250 [Clostridium botulinum B str. Osaka05]